MSEPVTNETDVVIVGYGPTGQTLALLLGRLGHRVTAIDRWPDLYPLPRAVHFDHEVARILQAAGVIEDINRISEVAATYQWRNAKHEMLMNLDWSGGGPSGWPVSNMFSQPDLERVIDNHVKRQPTVTVYQGWSAHRMTQDAEGVRIEMERGELRDGQWVGVGERGEVRARWVVGADGANSFVRRTLGIEMQDLGFAFNWLVVDVKPDPKREWVPKSWQLCDPKRPTTIVPGGPGRRRWEFMLLPGETLAEMNRADVSWKLLEPWDVTPANATLERHAVYTFRGQWATQWRQGRALLAGDAVHLTPPFAGQGMCSGLRDSMALAWRLDAVLSGRLSDRVLDSYGPERLANVQAFINFAVELGKVICITDPEVAAQRDREMLAAQQQPGFAPPPAPRFPLGSGLWLDGAPDAGQLGVQGRIRSEGREGLFDDVLGVNFAVIARDAETLAAISAPNRAALQAQGAVLLHIGAGGIEDLDGRYQAWLDGLGCVAALCRPDFYLYGGARDTAELNRLLDAWRNALAITD